MKKSGIARAMIVFIMLIQTLYSMEQKSIQPKVLCITKYQIPTEAEIKLLQSQECPFAQACKMVVEQTLFAALGQYRKNPRRERITDADYVFSYRTIKLPHKEPIFLPDDTKEVLGTQLWMIYNLNKFYRTFLTDFLEIELQNEKVKKNQEVTQQRIMRALESLPEILQKQVKTIFMQRHGSVRRWNLLKIDFLTPCKKCFLCTGETEWSMLSHKSTGYGKAFVYCACSHKGTLLSKYSLTNDYVHCEQKYTESCKTTFFKQSGKKYRFNFYNEQLHLRFGISEYPPILKIKTREIDRSIQLPCLWDERVCDSTWNLIDRIYERTKLFRLPNHNLVLSYFSEKNDQLIQYVLVGTTFEAVMHDYLQQQ